MKKLILLLVLAAAALAPACATAQKIESKSSTIFREEAPKKKPANKWWAIKAGGGLAISDTPNSSTYTGGIFNVSVSYNRLFVPQLYWGAQFGITNGKYYEPDTNPDYQFSSRASAYLGPKIGCLRALGKNTNLDAHLGVNAEVMFGDLLEGNGLFRLTPELGVGVWFGKLLAELQYSYSVELYDTHYNCHRILLNLGVKF